MIIVHTRIGSRIRRSRNKIGRLVKCVRNGYMYRNHLENLLLDVKFNLGNLFPIECPIGRRNLDYNLFVACRCRTSKEDDTLLSGSKFCHAALYALASPAHIVYSSEISRTGVH